MATHKGNSGVIKAVTEGGSVAAVGEVKSFRIDTAGDTIEDSAMGDSARTYLPGMTSWNGNIEAHYDPADAAQEDLVEGAKIDIEVYPTGASAGKKLTGEAIVTSVGIGNETEGVVSLAVNFQGTGALTRAAVGA